MEALLAIVLMVPFVGAVIAAAHVVNTVHEAGRKAAAELGLELSVHALRMELHGTMEGRQVYFCGGRKTLEVALSGLKTPARLAFTATSSIPSVERARARLAPDIEVGDAAVDDRWKLEGPDEGVVRALFSLREVHGYLNVWTRLSLSVDGTLEVERAPEPEPDIVRDVRRALLLASLLESLADIEPAEVPRAVRALLQARGAAGSSGLPVPVPSFSAKPE